MQIWRGHHYLLLIFFLLIGAVPVVLLIQGEARIPEHSYIEGRNLSAYPSLTVQKFQTAIKRFIQGQPQKARNIFFNQFINRSYQNNYESAISDHFPFRMPMIRFSKAVDRGMIWLSYVFLDDPATPADMSSGIYVLNDDSTIVLRPAVYHQKQKANIDRWLNNYAELIQAHPEISFFIFYYERLEYSEFHPLAKFFTNADRGRSLAYLENNLPDGVNFGKMTLSGLDDFYVNYYRTDHHWNVHGVWKAYQGIYDLLAKNYSEISPILECKQILRIPDLTYVGGLGRKTFLLNHSDEFEVDVVDFPECKSYSNGAEVDADGHYEYLSGDYIRNPFINHYSQYFGVQYDLLETRCVNQSDRSLLIIGTSFSRALVPYLAAHYHYTYYTDLRRQDGFNLSEFLGDHPVEDVLVIGDGVVLFSDGDTWLVDP